jgi:hypothetical protein
VPYRILGGLPLLFLPNEGGGKERHGSQKDRRKMEEKPCSKWYPNFWKR